MNKYGINGKLIFQKNGLTIRTITENMNYDLTTLNELNFKFNGYWEQAYFIGFPKIATKNGNENYLTIKTASNSLVVELFLESRIIVNRLMKYLDYYSDNGIIVNIQK
jgi:hypothetical protein